jgi:heat shock protein HslJ
VNHESGEALSLRGLDKFFTARQTEPGLLVIVFNTETSGKQDKSMKYPCFVAVISCLTLLATDAVIAADPPEAELVQVTRIWDKAPHNAFTDLLRAKDRWWCVFREGQGHVSPDGAIRVLTSSDGESWEPAALVSSPDSDLRDPKIVVAPDGRLMLIGAAYGGHAGKKVHRSFVRFSDDGRNWSEPTNVVDPDYWLWRVTWHIGTAYGVGYDCVTGQETRLYRSTNGKEWETLVERLNSEGQPNETSLLFLQEGTCLCLLRRDAGNGLLGESQPPYSEWTWKDLGTRIGGPHMLQLPDGRFVAAVRLYDGDVRTSLCWLDPKSGVLREFLKLPSGGDTSYPGLAWHDGLLWVSYYSSHEGKTSIYLAKVRLPQATSVNTQSDLTGASWLVEDIAGRGVIDRAQTFIRFDADGRVSGSTGCNRFSGLATIEGDTVKLGPLATTRRACVPALMDQEQKFLKAIEEVRSFSLDQNGLLYLLGADAQPLLRLSRMAE